MTQKCSCPTYGATVRVELIQRSFEVPLDNMECAGSALDSRIKAAVADYLGVPAREFDNCVVDRASNSKWILSSMATHTTHSL